MLVVIKPDAVFSEKNEEKKSVANRIAEFCSPIPDCASVYETRVDVQFSPARPAAEVFSLLKTPRNKAIINLYISRMI